MTKKKNIHQTTKAPLTYAITPLFEPEIREYIDEVHTKTGLPKNRIVSNLLLETIRRARKKFCPQISESSESINY